MEPPESRVAQSVAPPRPRWLWRSLLVLASVVVALGLGELGFRVVLRVRGTPWDTRRAEARVRELAATMRSSVETNAPAATPAEDAHVLHPYFGVDREIDSVELEERARRFRAGEYDDVFVVVALGGSVCAQTVNEQYDRLRASIAADPRFAGRKVELINQGRGGFKAPQQATLFVYLLALGWRPDAVIEIDGFNEVAVANGNWKSSVHPAHPMWGSWGLLASGGSDRSRELQLASECVLIEKEGAECARALLDGIALRSALLGHRGVARLAGIQSRWAGAQGRLAEYYLAQPGARAARGPEFAADDELAFRQFVSTWSENSRALHALCAEHGIAYVHVLQPTLHDDGSKPLTPVEIACSSGPKPWVKGAKRGYPLLRAAGAELARAGIGFVDLSLLFHELAETTYYDVCHFRGQGQELFADAIVTALLAELPRELPERRTWSRAR